MADYCEVVGQRDKHADIVSCGYLGHALLCNRANRYDQALEWLYKSMAASKLGKAVHQASILANMCAVKLCVGDVCESIDYGEKAIEMMYKQVMNRSRYDLDHHDVKLKVCGLLCSIERWRSRTTI